MSKVQAGTACTGRRRPAIQAGRSRARTERGKDAGNVMKKGLRCRTMSGGNQLRGGPGMKYVGIDWGYGWAAWCERAPGGAIAGEGRVPADGYGLASLVCDLGDDVTACVEMMSGAAWVRDQLARCGWRVKVADARRVKA